MRPTPDLLADEIAQTLWGAGDDGVHPEDLHVASGIREALDSLDRLSALGYVRAVDDRFRLTEAGRAYVARHLRPVTGMPSGRRGRVVHIQFDDGERLVRLSSLGIVPGAVVELMQRLPTFVVRTGETTVALDGEIAAGIVVRLLD